MEKKRRPKHQRGLSFYRLQEEFPVGTVSSAWIQPRAQDSLVAKHNFNCEICLTPGTSKNILLKCIYCNVVCHVDCLQRYIRQARHVEKWICFYCLDYYDNSRETHEQEKINQVRYEKMKKAQVIVAKSWRRYAARKWYLRIYLLIIRLQVMFHVRRRKKMFILSLQNKLRPMKIRLIRCDDLVAVGRETGNRSPGPSSPSRRQQRQLQQSLSSPSHLHARQSHQVQQQSNTRRRDNSFYVLISIMDNFKTTVTQTMRLASRLISLDVMPYSVFDLIIEEKIMLPGISGNSIIVLTVLQKGVTKDILLGQCSIAVGEDHIWKKGGQFSLRLEEQEFAIKDSVGVDMKIETKMIPTGTIDFELIPFNGMTSECGHCYATNPDEIVRNLNRLPGYRGFIIPHRSAASGGTVHNLGGHSDGGGTSNYGFKAIGSSDSFSIPMKRIWIVIADGLLYLYNHFGDQLKLIIELSAFSYNFEYKDHGHVLLYKIHKGGYPDFYFYTASNNDSLRWKCAFLCSVRSFTVEGGYQLLNNNNNNNNNKDRFDVVALLQDLWILESLKPNSGLVKEAEQLLLQNQRQQRQHRKTSQQATRASQQNIPALRTSHGQLDELAKLFSEGTSVASKTDVTGRLRSIRRSFIQSQESLEQIEAGQKVVTKQVTHVKKDDVKVHKNGKGQESHQHSSQSGGELGGAVNNQQVFMATGAKLLSDQLRAEGALDEIVANEKLQKHGETFVQLLVASIAEKKQLLQKTKSCREDLLEEYGLSRSPSKSSIRSSFFNADESSQASSLTSGGMTS
eukprot:gene3835-4188_t